MDDVMPPLEVHMQILQKGGWENVEVLTNDHNQERPRWEPVRSLLAFNHFINPELTAVPRIWRVYDVREKQR